MHGWKAHILWNGDGASGFRLPEAIFAADRGPSAVYETAYGNHNRWCEKWKIEDRKSRWQSFQMICWLARRVPVMSTPDSFEFCARQKSDSILELHLFLRLELELGIILTVTDYLILPTLTKAEVSPSPSPSHTLSPRTSLDISPLTQ